MDLAKGYYQLRVDPADQPKTAFTCHRGKFEFERMPFGVKNAPAAFQELMERVLRGEELHARPYMDDIVVFSSSWEDHVRHVRSVLEKLKEAGLTASPKKCHWGGSCVEFLGHMIGGGKMSLPQHRVTALAKYERPRSKKGLRAFLGSVSFYRRYVDKLASQTAILTPHTAKAAPSSIVWNEEGERAFECIRTMLCECGYRGRSAGFTRR